MSPPASPTVYCSRGVGLEPLEGRDGGGGEDDGEDVDRQPSARTSTASMHQARVNTLEAEKGMEALHRLEQTISRMLKCSEGRAAQELQTQQYLDIRTTVIKLLNGIIPVEGAEIYKCVKLGQQGLVVVLECQRGECVVTLRWSSLMFQGRAPVEGPSKEEGSSVALGDVH